MEVLQTSALPLGDGAASTGPAGHKKTRGGGLYGEKVGAGNGIRTRDFDLGKVALYH
jgi:hypothetical protein